MNVCLAQLRYLDSVLDWLAAENARPSGFAENLLDLRTIGVAGHSRGAKLAALHLVGEPSQSQRAYLATSSPHLRTITFSRCIALDE